MNSGTAFRWTDPTTWPWMIWVWLAIMAAGWAAPAWAKFRRIRAAGWPMAEGRIESVDVDKPFFSLSTRRGYYVAELGYSYSVAGNGYSGRYRRDLPTEDEADEFGRDLEGKPVTVHYSSDKPSISALLDTDIDTLQQNRPPAPAHESPMTADFLSGWSRPFLWFFMLLSAFGLILSLWVHLGAVMGRRVAPAAFFWGLHIGIFVVWFPAIFVAKQLVGNVNRKDLWKVVLKGTPDWVRYMVYGFFGYAVVNFALFMAKAPTGGSGTNPPAAVWRGFSGHWMAFYSAALGILYSAAGAARGGLRCVSGHAVPDNALYCQKCGQPVLRRA